MSEFTIQDADLSGVKGAVVVLTGSSSGIGLATVKLLLEHGAKVVGGDIQPSKDQIESEDFTFVHTDATSWKDLTNLFASAKSKYGRIDHVFANAGIARQDEYIVDKLDEAGNLLEPTHPMLDVNLASALNTVKLGIHHMKQNDKTSSIVVTASAAGLMPMRIIDYAASKHALVGVVRSLAAELFPALPIRINGLCPSWTDTAIITGEWKEKLGANIQSADFVARQTLLFMSDEKRHNELFFSKDGRCWEVNKELLKRTHEVVPF